MSKARKRATPKQQLAAVKVRMELRAVRFAEKAQKAMLATHAAADRGRRNRDWKASNVSADAAIIPDSLLLNARARQTVRDSWIGKASVRAKRRNVVGCGILPIPMVKDPNGKPLPKINKALLEGFWKWANDAKQCDVEKTQTFWQKQRLMEAERATVGEAILVWSYQKPTSPRQVGLKFQSFEADQFDLRLQSYTDVATGITNQVRGGVEVDENGAPVAYHFYTRNPNDYLPVTWKSIRIPAARVLHYFEQERVMQKRAVTPMTPVMQKIRDMHRYDDAMLWRAIMEACIGGVITREQPSQGSPLSMAPAPGDTGQTGSGMRTTDFVPGMITELLPNEKFESFIPTAPGNNFEPYSKAGVRAIGAGLGHSYGALARQSEGSYSSARQDMLEDRKEDEPDQELMAHTVVLPVWNLFVRFAVIDGLLDDVIDGKEFAADPERFCEAEYVAPAAPWIDPEKEANAFEKLVELKVMSREEIAALRGVRLSDIWDKLESEMEDAAKRGIALPENDSEAKTEYMRSIVQELVKNHSVDVADKKSLETLADETGLPKEIFEPAEVVPPPAPQINGISNGNGNGVKAGQNGKPVNGNHPAKSADEEIIDLRAKRETIARRLAQLEREKADGAQSPPHYRDGDAAQCCGTCSFIAGTECTKYRVPVALDKVCDSWDAAPVSRDDGGGRRLTGPYRMDGQPAIDAIQSDFTENPAYGNPPAGPAGIQS